MQQNKGQNPLNLCEHKPLPPKCSDNKKEWKISILILQVLTSIHSAFAGTELISGGIINWQNSEKVMAKFMACIICCTLQKHSLASVSLSSSIQSAFFPCLAVQGVYCQNYMCLPSVRSKYAVGTCSNHIRVPYRGCFNTISQMVCNTGTRAYPHPCICVNLYSVLFLCI